MTKTKATFQKRDLLGRKTRALRRDGIIPANVYGKKTDSLATQISLKDFNKLYSEVGETGLMYVTIEGETKERPCLISHVQYHPITDEVLHVDLRQVDLTEKVTADIPVELEGESPAVTQENATVVTQLPTIEVEALPTDLPERFVIDIAKLEHVGDVVKVSDLSYNKEVVTIDLDPETIIVTVQAQQEEEVIETPTPEEEEPAEASTAEGDQPAETESQSEGD